MGLFDTGSDLFGDGSTPAPVSSSTDTGSTNWLADASVLNNIALGWTSLFRNPSATIVPTGGGTYQVAPSVPAPAAVSYGANTLSASLPLLLVLGAVTVAIVLIVKK